VTPALRHRRFCTHGGTTAARFTLEAGWSWSECIKPIVGTDSCQLRHLGVV